MADIGLETDLANTNFAGARNPDDLLTVRFYEDAIPNQFKSTEESRPVFDNVVMISISAPGTALINEIQRRKNKSDEVRFPRQWRMFEQMHSNDPAQAGTPLTQWPLLNKGQCAMLNAVGFNTVEQIAFSSDEQIGRIGMYGGMQPHAFRDKAKRFLDVARDSSLVDKQSEAMAAMAKQIEDLKAMVASSQATIAPPVLAPIADVEREALVQQYQAKFGKKPHHKLSVAKLKESLEERAA